MMKSQLEEYKQTDIELTKGEYKNQLYIIFNPKEITILLCHWVLK